MNMWSAYIQLLADVLVTYYVAAYFKSSKMPWVVFGWASSALWCDASCLIHRKHHHVSSHVEVRVTFGSI